MHDEKLAEVLRELPVVRASEGFTASVMKRIEERPRSSRWRSLGQVAAAIALLAAGALGMNVIHERRADAEQREVIRHEQEQLRRELQQLKADTRAVEATIPIGSTDEAEVVVDVRELEQEPRADVVYAALAASDGY
jgi:hypothetical protein